MSSHSRPLPCRSLRIEALELRLTMAANLSVGPMAGGVNAHSGQLFVRTNAVAAVQFEYSKNADFSVSAFTASQQVTSAKDFTATQAVSGLDAETEYFYRVYIDGALAPQSAHSFRTFAEKGVSRSFSFAVTADAINVQSNPTVPAPAYFAAAADDPLFMLQIGDFDHRNPGNLAQMRTMHRQVLGPSTASGSDFATAIETAMPVFHMWDDHDYGANNGDKTFVNRTAALQAFREYYPAPETPNPAGLWRSFSAGQIDVLMLDLRSQRDPATDPDGPDKSMLDGDNIANGQKEWLKTSLLNSTATWKFIVSTVPFNPTTKPADAWGAYATERNELLSFIDANHITGVVVISGDLHSGGAIDNGSNAGLPEISVPHTNLNVNSNPSSATSGPPGVWSEGLLTGYANSGYVLVKVDGEQVTLEVKGANGVVQKSLSLGPTVGAPEISVSGLGEPISTGDATPSVTNGTDFGSTSIGDAGVTRTFRIANTGTAPLQLSGAPILQVTGVDASDFLVTMTPNAIMAPDGETTFQVTFRPTAAGVRNATLSIANNDGDEALYQFALTGAGTAPVQSEWILDDGEAGFSVTGTWGVGAPVGTYKGDQRFSAKGTGSNQANWVIPNLPAATYDTYVRWAGSGTVNRASNAPFTVRDGATVLDAVLVNQQVVPDSIDSNGVAWQRLGTYIVSSGSIQVSVTNATNGYVFADALRLVMVGGASPPVPEISVSCLGETISTGDATPSVTDGTNFGSTAVGGAEVTRAFSIVNTGAAPLHLSGAPIVQLTGADASDFLVTMTPSAIVGPGGETTFQVTFRPTVAGVRNATLLIASNDSDEPLYQFAIDGAGVAQQSTVVYRINAGGPAIAGSPAWGADTGASPSNFNNSTTGGNSATSVTSVSVNASHPSIPAGTPAAIFQTERFDKPAGANLLWDFPVTPGQYEVRLYFAETFPGTQAAGARVFDVLLEGAVMLKDYDIFAEVGPNAGVVKSFVVSSDEKLDIGFLRVKENPSVKAIEILRLSSPSSAAVTASRWNADLDDNLVVDGSDFLILQRSGAPPDAFSVWREEFGSNAMASVVIEPKRLAVTNPYFEPLDPDSVESHATSTASPTSTSIAQLRDLTRVTNSQISPMKPAVTSGVPLRIPARTEVAAAFVSSRQIDLRPLPHIVAWQSFNIVCDELTIEDARNLQAYATVDTAFDAL